MRNPTRSLSTAALALVALMTVACSKDSVTGSPSSPIAVIRAGQTVYTQDFSGAVDAAWSDPRQSTAPNGERFLGEFGNREVSLTLDNLSAHDSVTITVDVLAIRSWDGDNTEYGPDVFKISTGGVSLLTTTFSNGEDLLQSFPFNMGAGTAPAQTGAKTAQALGYTMWGDQVLDGTYRLTYTFAHTAGTVKIDFAAMGLQALDDESWGLDNVIVRIK